MREALLGAADALIVAPGQSAELGLAEGPLALRRAWPRVRDRLTLEYRAADGAILAGQWFAEREALDGVARATARHGPVARLALDGGELGEVLVAGVGVDRGLPGLRAIAARDGATLLAHRAERRAVVRLAQPEPERYAKVVAPARAEALGAALGRVAELAGAAFSAPEVLEVDSGAGVVVCSRVEGTALHESLAGDGAEVAATRAGSALVALHAQDPPLGASVHGAAEEAGVVEAWIDRVAALDPVLAARASAVAADVTRAVGGLGAPERAVPLHRDLHDKQILIGAEGSVGLIDFDTLAAGDPALDLANLLVHLELRALQGHCAAESAGRAAAALLEGYRPARAVEAHLDAYARATRLRLVCVYAFRPRSEVVVEAMLDRAADGHRPRPCKDCAIG